MFVGCYAKNDLCEVAVRALLLVCYSCCNEPFTDFHSFQITTLTSRLHGGVVTSVFKFGVPCVTEFDAFHSFITWKSNTPSDPY
jgi:hypothetical protein